jgi:hypothetical protein
MPVTLADFTVKVEVATSSTPATLSASFTDLASYVRAAAGIAASRGRANEYDPQAQPGRAQWEFRNDDARFTVGNSSSPYAPVQLRRPCRVRIRYSGTDYPIWSGFVDSIEARREETRGVAVIAAADRLARSLAPLPAALVADMLIDDPSYLFPLDEAEGTATAADVTGTKSALSVSQLGSGGTLDFGAGAAPGPDSGTVAAFTRVNATNGKRLLGTAHRTMAGGPFTVEAMVLPASSVHQMTAVRAFNFVDTFQYADLGTSSTGKAQAILHDTAVGFVTTTLTGTTTLSTTEASHIAVTLSGPSSGSYTARLYVNGVEEDSATLAESVDWNGSTFTHLSIGGHSGGNLWGGQISHVAGYPTALSGARIGSHADGIGGWTGDLTGDRFTRLTEWAGLTTGTQADVDGAGLSTMGPQPTKGQTLYALLRQVADAELGYVYVSNTGVLRFADRPARYDATVALELDATKPGHVVDGLVLTTDDGLLVNDLTAERPGGAPQRVVDAASVTAHGPQTDSATLYVDTDDQVRTLAQWRVYTASSPQPRSSQLTVDAVAFANNGGDVAGLLSLELGQRVQVTNLPADMAASSTLDLVVEGLAWRVDKNRISVTLTVSPLGASGLVAMFDDESLGVFDTGGVFAP